MYTFEKQIRKRRGKEKKTYIYHFGIPLLFFPLGFVPGSAIRLTVPPNPTPRRLASPQALSPLPGTTEVIVGPTPSSRPSTTHFPIQASTLSLSPQRGLGILLSRPALLGLAPNPGPGASMTTRSTLTDDFSHHRLSSLCSPRPSCRSFDPSVRPGRWRGGGSSGGYGMYHR